MKQLNQILLTASALYGLTMTGSATVIVNQTNWPDFFGGDDSKMIEMTNQNLPYTVGWHCGTQNLYRGTNGTLMFGPLAGSLTTWGYVGGTNYIWNTNEPPIQINPDIVLNVGQQVRVTVTMNFSNVADWNVVQLSRGLRYGLLYSFTNQQPLAIGGTIRQDNLTGYGQNMHFANVFSNQPLQTIAKTNDVVDTGDAIFAHDSQFIAVGDNGGGSYGYPGFTNDVPYTLIFNVAERATNAIDITTTWLGPNLTNGYSTLTATDTNWLYTNFDTFVFRAHSSSRVASGFTFTSFKVQTLPITPSAPQLTSAKKQGTSTILTWNCDPGYTYTVLRTNDLRAPRSTWPAIVTGYPVGYTTGSSISYTDANATATANFYRVQSP